MRNRKAFIVALGVELPTSLCVGGSAGGYSDDLHVGRVKITSVKRGGGLVSTSRVSLREITSETVREICALEVGEQQKNFVAANAESIAEAYFDELAWFRAIYYGETPVGFVMLSINPEANEYYLWRFMIDKKYQGHGYGKQAIDAIIEHVKSRPQARELTLSCVPGDGGPEEFYQRLGFQFTGEVDDGEKVYRLLL